MEERNKKTLVTTFKSRKTNKKLTIYKYIGKNYSEFKNQGAEKNLKEFNSFFERTNKIKEPEEQVPLLPKALSFYLFAVGPHGEYELYFSELSKINKNDIKYRRLYRMVNFYLHDEDIVKKTEELLLSFMTKKEEEDDDEDNTLFPLEWIEKKI